MTDQNPAYFDLARSWADERDHANARSLRIAWTVAAIAVAVALLQAVALALVMPLKTVVPMAVLVDRATGHVERVNIDEPASLTANQALRESMLAQYVIARESYDPISISAAYHKVALWSGGRARAGYLQGMKETPPSTKLAAIRGAIGFEATIKSISMLDQESALVRFDVAPIVRSGGREAARPYIATVAFSFRGQPMKIEDRLTNPLGFEVTSYRVAAEAAPAPAVIAAAMPERTMP